MAIAPELSCTTFIFSSMSVFIIAKPFSSHLFAYIKCLGENTVSVIASYHLWFKPHHCFAHEGLCVYCKSVFSFVLLFFLIFVCLSNWLFFPFMLLFPTTPVFDPFPPSVLYLSLSPLFPHCLPSLLLSFTPPWSLCPLLVLSSLILFPCLVVALFFFQICLSVHVFLLLLPPSSLHPSRRWSGGCHLGELALEVGTGQSFCPLTIWAWIPSVIKMKHTFLTLPERHKVAFEVLLHFPWNKKFQLVFNLKE